MKRIAIVGSGHLGQQIAYHIYQDTQDKVVAFFDDFQVKGTMMHGIPVIGGNDTVTAEYAKHTFDAVLIAVGYNHMAFRKQIFENLSDNVPFYTFIHSSVYMDKSVKIGKGSVIYPGCLIDQYVEIGDNVLMNVSGTVAHDSKIGNHCFLSPSVAIAGFVNMDEQCVVGINATIIDNISVAAQTQIGGGTVVIKSIEQPGLYVGNPARFIR
ncbi:acetyltransferase [Sphingobacterium sp. SGG-5]|uniref:acetyltransferase n=1 Tax=Sphingobacterium sp. SGG-5 TaxID=2710881 RepID=UPI0013EAB8E1|nr:acetyltransferase [Sphingobacterium sp. SGG-5]NGM63429.1 acetyltransferase [Sphingobacterium sp. SGG-5]